MHKSLLRLVCNEGTSSASIKAVNDVVCGETEYRQALLLSDACDHERLHGPNMYTLYVRKHEKRPPPAEARAIGLLMGKRVKASDGRWYPKKSAAEREFDRERKRRKAEFSETSRASRAVFEAVSAISMLKTLPEDLEVLSWHAIEIEAGLHTTVEWLQRFAAARSRRDETTRPKKSCSSSFGSSRPST